MTYLCLQGQQREILKILACLFLEVKDFSEHSLEDGRLDRTGTSIRTPCIDIRVIADSECVRLLFFHV